MAEAGTIVLNTGWNLDNLLGFLVIEGATVEQDNDGQIILCTDLYEDSEGNLRKL